MLTRHSSGTVLSVSSRPAVRSRLLPAVLLGAVHGIASAAGAPNPTPAPLQADGDSPAAAAPAGASAPEPQSLPSVQVSGTRSYAEKNLLPQTTESITAKQIAETVNVMDTEDALKYLPDMLVRKRYIGDTQAPMATRTTGINASARSLVYADGVLLTPLINNNNQNGSPQWFMVPPQEIDRIDVMYGPFAAQFPGNSYGAVTQITTRMPKRFEASVAVTGAVQHFSQYGTNTSEPSTQYSATLGDRVGKLSWWFSANHLNSFSQPITFGTVSQSKTPAGAGLPAIGGGFADTNRTGSAIQVIGASNFIHTIQDNATLKLAYDFTPTLTATYTLGYWQNRSKAHAETYLTDANGNPYYGAASGSVNLGGFAYSASTIAGQFASNNVEQEHLMQSVDVGTHTQGPFDWQLVVSNMDYLQDLSRLSTGLYPAALSGGPGRTTDMSGTGWTTVDAKGIWRPQGIDGAHLVSFGAHYDQFRLESPTYSTSDWISGGPGALYSNSLGRTGTSALWVQDAWRFAPSLTATLGGRYEWWRAYDGYNFSTAGNGAGVSIQQPGVSQSGFSPKVSLNWALGDVWSVTGSVGRALRFPTVGELYQSVQTGTTFLQANPFLKPEDVWSGELAIERDTNRSHLRLSAFDEYVYDALISQTSLIPGFATPVSFTQNVGKTRQMGVELAGRADDALIRGLSLSGNVTYVNAKILSNDSFVPTSPGDTSVGKRVPYVPTWRATLEATYRPDAHWAYTLAARYSSRVFATVDNSDVNAATFMGFQDFFVMDARVHYQFDRHWGGALGVDNLNNRKYFLYHPFPQRTFYAELKYDL
ncbi:TonB-dependent receptor [Paraburkholderia caballeronis]|uniref:Iron complex outermembrane recepter protein n=1 Tax=Paraburkholderia caballeronis TaxID=416943 RepID=A0A1H7F428_9BURK|nr:TonB-dependent receptor [Paraburkholderia caballeronis]PXW23856.1 iron complex outermembrane receptor protein [Paraburkholderia caballeronis]PXW99620.1 iron complex outermembrane receptor protein [Paraburkholderia caballeronis]RAJ96574.1 iron complex outermembrane receptor protein [Paraburkholderia caballeronis]SEE80201.1 iron complex outermembrane recepter protein [Paraburkholderia caballeronis]SEK18760.1 iron complex outermembrane recepter protein [Paraburkholderia caballeronis]